MEKLVRDNLPNIAIANGDPIDWRRVSNIEEHITFLEKKTPEERKEFKHAHNFSQTWKRAALYDEKSKQLYVPIFFGKVLEEIGDLLTVYSDLITKLTISPSHSQKIPLLQRERQDFVDRILSLGYNYEEMEQLRRTKNSIFGTFDQGIIASFKK